MIKTHPVSFGAITGLVIGVIVFVAGISLTPDYFILRAINVIQSPLIPVVGWLQGASHSWGSHGLYKLLVVVLCYWTLLGLVVGFGGRLTFGQKTRSAV